MVPHWPLRATLYLLSSACTRLLKTPNLAKWETWCPVLMLTIHTLQASGFVKLFFAYWWGIGLAIVLKLGCGLESPVTFKSHYAQTVFRRIKLENPEVRACCQFLKFPRWIQWEWLVWCEEFADLNIGDWRKYNCSHSGSAAEGKVLGFCSYCNQNIISPAFPGKRWPH